ncbi:MAG TPA: type IX secretion system membrane protein PorP/SprF [Bacteroidales bacterium]|nr:type IX secretion system membrane protein PorP/SprF [Bacteroidales bacterium]
MKFRGFICMVVIFAFTSLAYGQQEPQISHNMFNNLGINPGFAGLSGQIGITGIARHQWLGFNDADGQSLNPETYLLSADAPIPFLRGGLGLGFMQDRLGYELNFGVRLSYSYHVQLNQGKLGLGAQIGFLDKRFDLGKLTTIIGDDPALRGGIEESMFFTDFALGVFYNEEGKRWAGLSMSQIARSNPSAGEMFSLSRHAYFSGGQHFELLSLPDYIISPSLLVKTDFTSTQIDLNVMLTYNNRLWGGVSYRLRDAMVFFLGIKLDQIKLGYSYDFTTSAIGRGGRSAGSHEIMVKYSFDLDIERDREVQRNIRFL